MQQKYYRELVELFTRTGDIEAVEDLLEGILTPQEREELVLRLQIVKRLLAGETQHKIARELGVGVATVTRGSRELKAGRFKVLQDN